MDDMVSIEITVPQSLLSAVEEQSATREESVSRFFCRGAETLLRRHKERRMLEEYVQARTKMPDAGEVTEARESLEEQPDGKD